MGLETPGSLSSATENRYGQGNGLKFTWQVGCLLAISRAMATGKPGVFRLLWFLKGLVRGNHVQLSPDKGTKARKSRSGKKQHGTLELEGSPASPILDENTKAWEDKLHLTNINY